MMGMPPGVPGRVPGVPGAFGVPGLLPGAPFGLPEGLLFCGLPTNGGGGCMRSERDVLTTPVTVVVQVALSSDPPLAELGDSFCAVGFSTGRESSTDSPVACACTSMRSNPLTGSSTTSSSHSHLMPPITELPLRLPVSGMLLSMRNSVRRLSATHSASVLSLR